MDKLNVKIVKLEPMRVASFHAYGASPELEAASKLMAWVKSQSFPNTPGSYRVFGFNNPDPSPGSPNYGYEFWITVKPDLKPEKGVTIKEFGGGLYGVTRVNGVQNITPVWKKLAAWRAESNYQNGSHQWLEEHIGPLPVSEENLVLDLYVPIKE